MTFPIIRHLIEGDALGWREETITAAAAGYVAPAADVVEIANKPDTTGAVAPAFWAARASAPAHTAKFQTANDSRWWELADFTIRPEMCSSVALGPSGTEAANLAALNMALDAIKQRGYGRLLLSTVYHLAAPLAWAGNNLWIDTENPGAGLILNHTGDAIQLGAKQSLGGAQQTNIILSPITIAQNVPTSTGAGVAVWNTELVKILGPKISGMFQGIVLGEESASISGNDVLRASIWSPDISVRASTGAAVALVNGAIFVMDGGLLNGTGAANQPAMTLGGAAHNWDGARVSAMTWEQWSLGAICRGAGCANVDFYEMQQDRAAQFGYDFSPASGATCLHIGLHLSHIYDNEAVLPNAHTGIGIQASTDNGGTVDDVRVMGNELAGFGAQAVRMKGVLDARVDCNTIRNNGSSSSGAFASVLLDTCDGYSATGNHIRSTYHKYGIDRTGSSNGKSAGDLATLNNVIGALTAATN